MNNIAKYANGFTWVFMTFALITSIISAAGGESPSWTLVFLLYVFCFISHFGYTLASKNKE